MFQNLSEIMIIVLQDEPLLSLMSHFVVFMSFENDHMY